MTKEEIKKLKTWLRGIICDKYCRKPFEIADDELLMVVCNKCPVEELLKLERSVIECEKQEHQPLSE